MKDEFKNIMKNIHLKEMLKKQHDFIVENDLSGEAPLGINKLVSNGIEIPKDKNNFIDFNNLIDET